MSEDETTPFIDNGFSDPDVPPKTKWRSLFCGSSLWTPGKTGLIFIDFSRLQFFPFFFFCFLCLATCYRWFVTFLPVLPPVFQYIKYSFGFSAVYSVIGFFMAFITSPGILPYYWAADKRKKYTRDELRSGISITEEQSNYAKDHDVPSRAFFSRKYGYTILRADHYCCFINNFVGIRNHRFFLIGLYAASYYMFIWVISLFYIWFYGIDCLPSWQFYLHVIVGGWLAVTMLQQAFTQTMNITANRTIVETIKKVDTKQYDKGCFENWEEVCGPRKYMLCWPLPVKLPSTVDPFEYPPAPKDENSVNL